MNREKKIIFGKISANFAEKSTVIEPTGSFSTFVPSNKPKQIEALEDDTEHHEMKEIMGITSFGKKAKSFNVEEMMEQVKKTAREITKPPIEENLAESDEDSDDSFIGPPIPAGLLQNQEKPVNKEQHDKESDDEVEESDDENEIEDHLFIPSSHEVVMQHGNRAVAALSVDPSGARLASGSVDYDVSFWDFAGMDSSMRSFRTLLPCDNHPIRYLNYSGTGDLLLVISGAAQAKILDRDGFEQFETVKGDMYISDQAKTKGHTAALLSGCWNPISRDEFLTTSSDGTARTWDLNTGGKIHKNIVKCRAQNGLKTAPTACNYNRDGRMFACGCADGSIQIWDLRKSVVAPATLLRKAHEPVEFTSISYSHIGYNLITRSCDESLKLWDVRNLKKSVFEVANLYVRYDTTDAIFSPNDKIVVTSTSVPKDQTSGILHFYDSNNFQEIRQIPVTTSHVIKICWHPKLNQIFTSTGNGLVKCYYDSKRSLRGATLCAVKTKRKIQQAEIVSSQQVITPHALPLFRTERRKTSRKQMEKDRLDPVKSRRPDLPITSGQGGRVASSGGTLSSYVIRNLGLSKRVDDDQDPREAILKYAKEAEENPYWITPAYKKTQPQVVLDENEGGEPSNKKSKPN